MILQVNGETKEVSEEVRTVADLLEELEINENRVAVELNEEVVPGDRYKQRDLEEGSEIEIVTFVGGG